MKQSRSLLYQGLNKMGVLGRSGKIKCDLDFGS